MKACYFMYTIFAKLIIKSQMHLEKFKLRNEVM
jgi:hypothetical protein